MQTIIFNNNNDRSDLKKLLKELTLNDTFKRAYKLDLM